MTDQEKFFAWLDGELSQAEAAEMERRVASDPKLAKQAAEHRRLADSLRSAFEPIFSEPVPERISRAAAPGASNVVRLSHWRSKLARPFTSPASQWGAMAASLAIGLVAGGSLLGDTSSSPVEVRGGQLYAAGAVEQALETKLASAAASEGVRIGLTFRDGSGAICRTFDAQANGGIACRGSEGWRVRGLLEAPEGQRGEYRMAAGPDPQLMEMVDSMIDGEPFDAGQEASAKQRGWR